MADIHRSLHAMFDLHRSKHQIIVSSAPNKAGSAGTAITLQRLCQSRSLRARIDIQPSAVRNTPPGTPPGFIVPRLQALVMNEAARMVQEGVASAEDIDTATRYGMGLRFAAIGVVEFIDFGGVVLRSSARRVT